MNIHEYTQPDKLERICFIWSELRLVIASIALFVGGIPPVLMIMPSSMYGITNSLLTLAWIISGIVSAYLLYRWNAGNRMLFGGKNTLDTTAFFVNIVSGLNLGIVGILGTNIGMKISTNQTVFVIIGILYLVSALYLFKRWKEFGQKIF